MEGDTVQPTRISKEEYVRFKQFVQDMHGKTRGHLSTEIENALREYREPDNQQDKLTRIEEDMAHVKSLLAEAEADGGSPPPTPENQDVCTHADSGKPRENGPRSAKIEHVIDERLNPKGGSGTFDAIRKQVEHEFSFSQRTAKDYVPDILEELDAKQHPENADLYVWGDAIDQLVEESE